MREVEDGAEVVDLRTGAVVAWAEDVWLAQQWTAALNGDSANRADPDDPGAGER